MHRRGHHRAVVNGAALAQQGELEVRIAAALAHARATAVDGDRAAHDEIDVRNVTQAYVHADTRCALDRRRPPRRLGDSCGVEKQERLVVRQSRHRHVEEFAGLERSGPHRRLG